MVERLAWGFYMIKGCLEWSSLGMAGTSCLRQRKKHCDFISLPDVGQKKKREEGWLKTCQQTQKMDSDSLLHLFLRMKLERKQENYVCLMGDSNVH